MGSCFLTLATYHSLPYHTSPCSSCDVCKEQLVKWQINLIPLGWKIESGKLLLVLLWLLCLLGSDFWHFLLAAVTTHKLHSQGPDKLVWHWWAAWPTCCGRVFLLQLPGLPPGAWGQGRTAELDALLWYCREGHSRWWGAGGCGGEERLRFCLCPVNVQPILGWRWSRKRQHSELIACFSVCQMSLRAGWEEPFGHEDRGRGTPCVW